MRASPEVPRPPLGPAGGGAPDDTPHPPTAHPRTRALAILFAAAVLVLDQASKLAVLEMREDLPIALAPFFDVVLVWNRGISYGLLQQEGAGRWLLIAFTLAATLALAVWAMRTPRPLLAAALGAVVGGAVGNLIDRIAYGAVVDFAHFHVGTFSWYVFNVADAAIVLGVAVLLLDSVFTRRPA